MLFKRQLDTNVKGPAGNGYSRAKASYRALKNRTPILPVCSCLSEHIPVKAEVGYSRSDSVESTGLQLQQAVLPILPGHPEVVYGASNYHELVAFQGEVCFALGIGFSAKSFRPVLQLGGAQMRPAEPRLEGKKKKGMQKLLQSSAAARLLLSGHTRLLALLFSPGKGAKLPAPYPYQPGRRLKHPL